MGGFLLIALTIFSASPLLWIDGFKWQMAKCSMLSAIALSNYCSRKLVLTPVLYSNYVNWFSRLYV
jgi:hypothetical protein